MSSPVLLIEPDAQEGDFYTEILEELSGGTVDRVTPDEGTLQRVSPANYQLIILDSSTFPTPEDELSWIERIRHANPAASLVVLSDHATVEQAVAAIRLGAEDYLRKPVSIDAFRMAIKRGLDRKTVFAGNSGLSAYLNLVTACQLVSASIESEKIHEIVRVYFKQELQSQYVLTYVKGVRMGQDSGDPVQQLMTIAIESARAFERLSAPSSPPYLFVDPGSLGPGLFVFRYRDLEGRSIDCVCLSPKKPDDPTEFDKRVKLLLRQINVTFVNMKEFQGVKALVYVDDVTGLYNTRYLNDVLEKEIASARAGKNSFAVLFIDADHFKQVNDQHGHLVGSKLLNELGDQIQKLVRDQDIVFRYGGDEFVAVLKRTDLQTARMVGERIRKGIEGRSFLAADGLNIRFTVSVGIAIFPDHAVTKKEIIDIADRAMYEAKRQSRNLVFVLPSRKAPQKVAKSQH